MKLEYNPSFLTDLLEAAQYHSEIEPDLGKAFITEVEEVVLRIQANPLLYSNVYRDVRRLRLTRFKFYAVRFRVVESKQTIRILSIVHGARHPDYSKGRQ